MDNENILQCEDSKELRKKLELPITKDIVYWRKDGRKWTEHKVVSYKIVDVYEPSGSCSIVVILDSGEEVRILQDYLSDMQKPTFVSDVDGEGAQNRQPLASVASAKSSTKVGKRIDAAPESYVVVDLETTGLNHYNDDIIEIGAIKYMNGTEIDRYSVYVKTDKQIPKGVTRLTEITNEILEEQGIDKASAIMNLYMFLGDELVIGHNFTTFDKSFIDDAYMNVLGCHFPNDFIDTIYVAKDKCPDLDHHRLEDLAEKYAVDYSKAHRAAEDCLINHIVYEFMVFGKLLDEKTAEGYLLESDNEEELVEVDDKDDTSWKGRLLKKLDELTAEFNLPDNSLNLMANIGRLSKNITSYSICIYEPDLVEENRKAERNTIVTRIVEGQWKTSPDELKIETKNQNELDEIAIPEDAAIVEPKNGLRYIRINQNSDDLISYLSDSIRYAVEHYTPKAESFACCARYDECSDEKRCVHRNQLYSKACQYRRNLEDGKIFYGKNKTEVK